MTAGNRSYTPSTLGLRLGFMTSFIMLGIPPLIRVYVAFRLNAGEDEVFYELPFDIWIILSGITAIATLIATMLAWRGRPPQMQWIFQLILIATLAFILIEAGVRYIDDCEGCLPAPGGDIFNRVFRFLIPVQVLVTVYTIWYINREPARQFYEQFRE